MLGGSQSQIILYTLFTSLGILCQPLWRPVREDTRPTVIGRPCYLLQAPGITFKLTGEIKRREVSWTLSKKLDSFAGPVEIKTREVVLDSQISPAEIKSRDVELGLKVRLLLHQLFPSSGATDIVFVTLFRTAFGTVIVWYTSCCAMAKRTLP